MHCVSRSKLTVVWRTCTEGDAQCKSQDEAAGASSASNQTPPEPFPTAASFADAARAFVSKYPQERTAAQSLGPERTNAGWEWRTKSDRVGLVFRPFERDVVADKSSGVNRAISRGGARSG